MANNMTLESVKKITTERLNQSMPKAELLDAFVQLPRSSTLLEVFEHVNEGWESLYGTPVEQISSMHYSAKEFIHSFYPHWVDLKSKVAREDNMLTHKADKVWQQAYDEGMLSLITTSRAKPLDIDLSIYSSYNYKASQRIQDKALEIVSVQHMVEDKWSSFADSFSANNENVGIFAEVTYNDRSTFFTRWEGNFQEAILSTLRRTWDSK